MIQLPEKKLFGKTAGHQYLKDQMNYTCTKSKINKGSVKVKMFPFTKGTRYINRTWVANVF